MSSAVYSFAPASCLSSRGRKASSGRETTSQESNGMTFVYVSRPLLDCSFSTSLHQAGAKRQAKYWFLFGDTSSGGETTSINYNPVYVSRPLLDCGFSTSLLQAGAKRQAKLVFEIGARQPAYVLLNEIPMLGRAPFLDRILLNISDPILDFLSRV